MKGASSPLFLRKAEAVTVDIQSCSVPLTRKHLLTTLRVVLFIGCGVFMRLINVFGTHKDINSWENKRRNVFLLSPTPHKVASEILCSCNI